MRRLCFSLESLPRQAIRSSTGQGSERQELHIRRNHLPLFTCMNSWIDTCPCSLGSMISAILSL